MLKKSKANKITVIYKRFLNGYESITMLVTSASIKKFLSTLFVKMGKFLTKWRKSL